MSKQEDQGIILVALRMGGEMIKLQILMKLRQNVNWNNQNKCSLHRVQEVVLCWKATLRQINSKSLKKNSQLKPLDYFLC